MVGRLKGHTLAYVGDGNNVARSLALACGKLGLRFAMGTPSAYQFDAEFLDRLQRETPDLELSVTSDPAEAVRGAIAIYTDVWTSMGQEQESQKRRRDFEGYQVDTSLMRAAGPNAYFMHCLPAHRGEEVTSQVIDGPQSIVIEQAANRMHVQKGILAWLLNR
jgi:ornithine carbamoyltransferase